MLASRSRRSLGALALAVALAAVSSGCSAPKTGSASLAQGKQRVERLVLAAARALPGSTHYTPPTEVGTQPCRKTVAGFVIGRTGAHRAEVPLIVGVPAGSQLRLLGVIQSLWAKAGYKIDRSRINEPGFPQLSADTPDGDHLAATAFVPPRTPAQIALYAVSACLRGP